MRSSREVPWLRTSHRFSGLTGTVLTLSVAANGFAQCSYTLRLLDEPPHPQCPLTPAVEGARGINNHGEVVGEYLICSGVIHPCRWDAEGKWSKIVIPGESKGTANGINDDGFIVGFATIFGKERWWTWNDGVVTVPDPPCTPVNYAMGTAALSNGDSAGTIYCIGPRETVHSFLHSTSGEWIDIGVDLNEASGPGESLTRAAHDVGYVVGVYTLNGQAVNTRAFRWRAGEALVLPPVIGGYTSQANDVNRWGDVVGHGGYKLPNWERGDPKKGFTYIDGVFADPGFLPGMNATALEQINDLGQAIGFSGEHYILGGEQYAVLVQHGEMHILKDHVLDPKLYELSSVGVMNDRGEFTATVHYGGTFRVAVFEPVRERVGDVDLDCKVGMHDLKLVLKAWGSTYTYDYGPGDANNDRIVDANDLALVLGGWDAVP